MNFFSTLRRELGRCQASAGILKHVTQPVLALLMLMLLALLSALHDGHPGAGTSSAAMNTPAPGGSARPTEQQSSPSDPRKSSPAGVRSFRQSSHSALIEYANNQGVEIP